MVLTVTGNVNVTTFSNPSTYTVCMYVYVFVAFDKYELRRPKALKLKAEFYKVMNLFQEQNPRVLLRIYYLKRGYTNTTYCR